MVTKNNHGYCVVIILLPHRLTGAINRLPIRQVHLEAHGIPTPMITGASPPLHDLYKHSIDNNATQ